MIVNKSMYPLQTGFNAISRMQSRVGTLQNQLATGQKSQTLAGMGADRSYSISVRARLAKLEGYSNTMTAVGLRLDVMGNTIKRLDKMEGEIRSMVQQGAYGTANINLATVPTTAKAMLDEVMTLLNSEVNGRFLFGGGTTDRPPVEEADAILNGSGGRAGFATVAAERRAADAGATGLGRVTVAAVADTVTLAEDGAHPFGFKLGAVSSSSPAVTLTQASGAPPAATMEFTAVPVAGHTVTVGLTLPDGSSETITLTAVASTAPGEGEFVLGADADATAANFAAALDTALRAEAAGTLATASNFAAANDFFAGPGETVMRVDGPPFDSATALVAATAADTVSWYRGEDAGSGARRTVGAQIDDATRIDYGVQANESGLADMVKTLAAMAIETFPSADPTSRARFDAMAARQATAMSEANNVNPGSVEFIATELGLARAAIGNTQERHKTYKVQMEGMLSDLETVPKEDVAMELLALQTRLQASYQVTASVAQLTLVNYVR